MLEIRPLTLEDYPALVVLRDACWPTQKRTLEELRSQHAQRRQDLVFLDFLALEDGILVGVVSASREESRLESGAYWTNLMVHPQAREREMGAALYTYLLRELEPHQPKSLCGKTQEGQFEAVRFLEARNWREHSRSWESRLELDSFDPKPFAGAAERALESGYHITTFDLLERQDPDARRKLYDLDCDAGKDVPGEDDYTQPSFERFWEQITQNPNYRPELWVVALDSSGSYAGFSQLYTRDADTDLSTGFTGTGTAHRRKGVALALRLKAIEYALERRAPRIRTNNSQANRPMLSINEVLGFQKQPAWIEYRLEWNQT
jgi:mycothiol synthase